MLLVPTLAAVTLSLSDGSAADVRSVPERHAVALDLGTSPAAELTFAAKRSAFTVGYRPHFGWIDVTDSRDFVVQHTAGMGYAWGTARLQLKLAVDGTYGKVTYLNAAPAVAQPNVAQPATGSPGMGDNGAPTTPSAGAPDAGQPQPGMDPATPQLLPQVSVLEVGAASAALTASYLFTRRWSGALGIGFSVGGGLRGSDAYLPLRYGPFASAGVSYQLTQADGLTSALSGSLDILPKRHTRFQTITLLESWVHKFDPLTVGTVGAGATYLRGKAKGSPTTRAVNAAGLAALNRAFKLDGGAVLGVGANATLNSAYNPVLGDVTQGLSGGVGATWARKRLAFNAGVQGSHSLPFDDPQAFRSYGASGGATYQLSQPIALNAGAYWSHQVLPPTLVLSTTDPNRWGATLGVTVVAPPIKF